MSKSLHTVSIVSVINDDDDDDDDNDDDDDDNDEDDDHLSNIISMYAISRVSCQKGVSIAGSALLAGYRRYVMFTSK